MMDVLETEAEDFSNIDGAYEIATAPSSFSSVRDVLRKGIQICRSFNYNGSPVLREA